MTLGKATDATVAVDQLNAPLTETLPVPARAPPEIVRAPVFNAAFAVSVPLEIVTELGVIDVVGLKVAEPPLTVRAPVAL